MFAIMDVCVESITNQLLQPPKADAVVMNNNDNDDDANVEDDKKQRVEKPEISFTLKTKSTASASTSKFYLCNEKSSIANKLTFSN